MSPDCYWPAWNLCYMPIILDKANIQQIIWKSPISTPNLEACKDETESYAKLNWIE